MRNHSIWILALLAAGLTLCVAHKTAGETFDYNGNPDQPFPDAWGDPDVDCDDPHDPGESDCWKCEGSSPAVPVPKFQWILTRDCPTFSMSNTVQSNCYCVLAGEKLSDSYTAEYVATDGKKSYSPSIDGCGGDPPEDEPITQDIEWTWSTSGLATVPASGKEQTATFDYIVPEGSFSIEVIFSAKATPSDTNCNEITAGPEVIGKITGGGYSKYIPPPTTRDNPQPQYVEGIIINSDGDEGFGSSSMGISHHFECNPVCVNSGCELYRIEGKYGVYSTSIRSVKCIKVTVNGCSDPIGSCKPRSQDRMNESLAHEQKHLNLWWDFIDEWNAKVEDLGLFDSCDFCNIAKNEFIAEFNIAYAEMLTRQKEHCPDFDGDPLYSYNGCGTEIFMGFRDCN